MINVKVYYCNTVIYKSRLKVKVNVAYFGMFTKVFPQGIHMRTIKSRLSSSKVRTNVIVC